MSFLLKQIRESQKPQSTARTTEERAPIQLESRLQHSATLAQETGAWQFLSVFEDAFSLGQDRKVQLKEFVPADLVPKRLKIGIINGRNLELRGVLQVEGLDEPSAGFLH